MSNIKVPSLASLFRVFVTEEMKFFSSYLQDNNLDFKIGLIDPNFYLTLDEIKKLRGPTGWYGCTGKKSNESDLPPGNIKNFTLKFTINKLNNEDKDNIKILLDLIKKTNGGRNNTYSHFNIKNIKNKINQKFGLKKTQLFIDTYEAFKKHLNYSELDLTQYYHPYKNYIHHQNTNLNIYEYNPDFVVEENYDENNEELYVAIYQGIKYEDSGYFDVEIELLNSDLTEENVKIISKIIEFSSVN